MAKIKTKYKRGELLPIAESVRNWISETGQRVEICGSLRRGNPVVHDIDLVIAGPLSKAIAALERAAKDGKCEVLSLTNLETCKTRGSVLVDGVQVDLYVAQHEWLGAMTLFLTGSKVLNILMRQRALDMGYKLNQYGLFHNGEIIAGREEEQVFLALGLVYLTPEQRSLEWGDQLQKEGGVYAEGKTKSRKDGKKRAAKNRSACSLCHVPGRPHAASGERGG